MPLLFCGSNVLNQFRTASQLIAVRKFESIPIDNVLPHEHVLVASTWCYVVFAVDKRLILQGLLNEQPNTLYEVQTTHTIKQISCCDKFVLILLENGQLFKILPKKDAVLEEVKLDKIIEPLRLPHKRNTLGEIKNYNAKTVITHIACGDTINVAIDNENRVYSVPSEIYRFPKQFKVKQLVCGFEHALLLNSNGDIYAWGTGLRGQLGKDDVDEEETPLLVEALAGVKITYIAAGGWHSAAISTFGDLYVWGFDCDGQLGLGPVLADEGRVFHLPQITLLPECQCETGKRGEECVPVKVFAGARHIVLIRKCKAVYAAGRNVHGQLGLKSEEVSDLSGAFWAVNLENVPSDFNVICGHWNTFIQWIENENTVNKEISTT